MPWNRPEPDPLKRKRQELAEQQRQLEERMSQLQREIHAPAPSEDDGKPIHPLWRMEDEAHPHHPAPVKSKVSRSRPARRNLGRQRQRDRLIFFGLAGVLILVGLMVFYLFRTHYDGSLP